jgi:group I intron endonuclease
MCYTYFMYGCIYAIVFPNGKVYIGQTIQEPIKRFNAHIAEAIRNSSQSYHSKVANAIRKYKNEIYLDVLYDRVPSYDLDFLERRTIYFYDSVNNGYNILTGGNSNKSFKHTEQTKQKLKIAHLGKKLSASHKDKISQSLKKNPPWLGRKHTEESKKKISLNHGMKGKKHTLESLQKISFHSKGSSNPMYGKTHSPETIEKMRKIKLGKTLSENTRKKMSEAGKKRYKENPRPFGCHAQHSD